MKQASRLKQHFAIEQDKNLSYMEKYCLISLLSSYFFFKEEFGLGFSWKEAKDNFIKGLRKDKK